VPRFSIIIPSYNAALTLGRAIDSVLAQTDDDWECVIVDDGSTDDTAKVIASYCKNDKRFFSKWQENAGTAAALNTAATLASGDFLVHFDADDELMPTYCEQTSSLIDARPDYDIYAANALQVTPSDNHVLFNNAESFSSIISLTIEDLIVRPEIYVTAAIRKEIFVKVGGFCSNTYNEDYDFWLKALAMGARHVFQPEVLSVYHVSPQQKTANALRVRESDFVIIENLINSGLLSDEQVAIARRKQTELQKNIATRKRLYKMVGQKGAERIIALKRSSAEGST